MRTTPKLRFHYDELVERGNRLEALIERAVRDDARVSGHDIDAAESREADSSESDGPCAAHGGGENR
jgi:hypothetical protein